MRNALCCLLLAGAAQQGFAACVADGPVQTARWIYSSQRTFTVYESPQDAALMQRFLSPLLLRLMQVEWRCQVIEEGLCALDTDPWTNSGDATLPAPVSFTAEMAAATRANIRMRFHPGRSVEPRRSVAAQATLRLSKDEVSGCWRLDDIIGAKGRSLLQQLREYRFYP